MDLKKIQFLQIDPERLRAFRRKRALVLFVNALPERILTHEEWVNIVTNIGKDNIKTSGLCVRTCWTLVEVPLA